jgi:hypothetical protein
MAFVEDRDVSGKFLDRKLKIAEKGILSAFSLLRRINYQA